MLGFLLYNDNIIRNWGRLEDFEEKFRKSSLKSVYLQNYFREILKCEILEWNVDRIREKGSFNWTDW
jgi:hypothetical protein